jgi:hypothetical protein
MSSLVLFVLALLVKTSVVMLPFVLLLLAWWRRGRVVRSDVIRSVPFFVAALLLGLVTVWFQYERSILGEVVRPEGMLSRLAAAGWSVWFYLYKLLLPVRLVMIYPRWDVDGSSVLAFVPLVLLLACLAVLWVYRKQWARGPLCAAAYFLVTLVPVLGFVDMSFMKFSLVADHFQYVPMLGMVALFAAGLTELAGRAQLGTAARYGASLLLVPLLAVLTARQAGYWKDQESLWSHTIDLNDQAWVAHYSRGLSNCVKGDWDRAIQDCNRAIELKPDYFDAYNNRAIAYGAKGDVDRMIQDCSKAIALKPDYAQAYNNRILAYYRKGLYDKAWDDVAAYRRLGGKVKPAFLEALSKVSGGRKE